MYRLVSQNIIIHSLVDLKSCDHVSHSIWYIRHVDVIVTIDSTGCLYAWFTFTTGAERWLRLRFYVWFFRHRRWLWATAYMYMFALWLSFDFYKNYRVSNRDKSVRRLRGDRMGIVNFSAVIAQSPQAFYGNSTEPVRLPCEGRTIFFGQHVHRKSCVCCTIIAGTLGQNNNW